MSQLQPGADGEPLEQSAWVLRVCKLGTSKYGKITEANFAPSSKEKEDHPHHRLSVFAEELTTQDQAYLFLNADSQRAFCARLKVEDVLRLRAEPSIPDVPHLAVEWHPLLVHDEKGDPKRDENGSPIPDPRQGASGHAGIKDLTQGQPAQRRSLRMQLAELAQREWDQRTATG